MTESELLQDEALTRLLNREAPLSESEAQVYFESVAQLDPKAISPEQHLVLFERGMGLQLVAGAVDHLVWAVQLSPDLVPREWCLELVDHLATLGGYDCALKLCLALGCGNLVELSAIQKAFCLYAAKGNFGVCLAILERALPKFEEQLGTSADQVNELIRRRGEIEFAIWKLRKRLARLLSDHSKELVEAVNSSIVAGHLDSTITVLGEGQELESLSEVKRWGLLMILECWESLDTWREGPSVVSEKKSLLCGGPFSDLYSVESELRRQFLSEQNSDLSESSSPEWPKTIPWIHTISTAELVYWVEAALLKGLAEGASGPILRSLCPPGHCFGDLISWFLPELVEPINVRGEGRLAKALEQASEFTGLRGLGVDSLKAEDLIESLKNQWFSSVNLPLRLCSNAEIDRGNRHLIEHGWQEGSETVFLSVAADTFLLKRAVRTALKQGFSVICYNTPEPEVLSESDRIIAPKISPRGVSTWARVALISSRLCITDNCELALIARLFGVPVLQTHVLPPYPYYFGDELLLPSIMWNCDENRCLSWSETAALDLRHHHLKNDPRFEEGMGGIVAIENTPVDLEQGFLELLERISDPAWRSKADQDLISRWQSCCSYSTTATAVPSLRFLKRYEALLT